MVNGRVLSSPPRVRGRSRRPSRRGRQHGGLPSDNGSNGGGGDNLPKTGQNVAGLIALSLMLMAGGVAARIVARKPRRRPVAG